MLKKHYDRITLKTALYFVGPLQEIEVMKFKYPSEAPTETLYKGKRNYIYERFENSEVMGMQARGDVLVIEVKE